MIVLHVGCSGSGKTWALAREAERFAAAGARVVVLDTLREWSECAQAPWAVASSPAEVEKAPPGYIVVIWPASADPTAAVNHEQWIGWALRRRDVTLVVPEAHMLWPVAGGLDPQSKTLLTQYRHYRVNVLADTQRLASLSKACTEQARIVRVFAMVGERDLSILNDMGGRALADAAEECAVRLRAGERGWHVHVERPSIPPYSLYRYGE